MDLVFSSIGERIVEKEIPQKIINVQFVDPQAPAIVLILESIRLLCLHMYTCKYIPSIAPT